MCSENSRILALSDSVKNLGLLMTRRLRAGGCAFHGIVLGWVQCLAFLPMYIARTARVFSRSHSFFAARDLFRFWLWVARPRYRTTASPHLAPLPGAMAVGVILCRSELAVPASFYVPTESLALDRLRQGLSLASSHVLLEIDSDRLFQLQVELKLHQWSQLAGPQELLLIAPVPTSLDDVNLELRWPNVSLVMLVPVVDSVVHWSKLRRLNKTHRLILHLSKQVPPQTLERYKCLNYDAVVATCASVTQAGHLIAKRPSPHLLVHQDELGQVLMLAFVSASHFSVLPHSDELIDPLQPLTRDLGLEVYQTFEEDKVKYSQYDAAIEMAIDDLRHRNPRLTILVVGPGRGPLLRMVMNYTSDEDTVMAIEKNPNCIDILRENALNRSLVTVVQADVRDAPALGYDLIVSELLGSFGCNEACPEILQHFTSAHTIMIPQSYTTYLQPAYCDILEQFRAQRPYVASLNSVFSIGPPVPIFEFLHPGTNKLDQSVSFKVNASPADPCNVLMGYFEAQLYGPIRIGITPQMNNHERCSSWYPMVFPVGLLEAPATVTFSRKSTKTVLWYEWEVNDLWFNHNAAQYAIDL